MAYLPPFGDYDSGAVLILGSGSKVNSDHGALVRLDPSGLPQGKPVHIDLAPFYDYLKKEIPELDIEGAGVRGDGLHLLQRGDDGKGRNARIEVDLDKAWNALAEGEAPSGDAVRDIEFYDLGQLQGVKLCFSDAAPLPDGRIAFITSAEMNQEGAEGAKVGSAVGVLDAQNRVAFIEPFDSPMKVEGLVADLDGTALELLMVADADDPSVPSPLLSARVEVADA
jgi:hypothetical protein